jgi:hypothetical protein
MHQFNFRAIDRLQEFILPMINLSGRMKHIGMPNLEPKRLMIEVTGKCLGTDENIFTDYADLGLACVISILSTKTVVFNTGDPNNSGLT